MGANAFQRHREHAQSSPETAEFHPEAWRRMRRRGIESGASIFVHGKVLSKSFPWRRWTSRSSRVLSRGKLVPLRRQELPELSISLRNVRRCFSVPEQGPLTNARVHGKRRPALAYARDGKRPCCSCDFHSRVRLVHHLSYSSVKCLVRV